MLPKKRIFADFFLSYVAAFNLLDLPTNILHSKSNSDFGRSLVFTKRSRLLVGAPKSNIQGDLFSCELTAREQNCTDSYFGNITILPYEDSGLLRNLDNENFGFSMTISEDNILAVCAPRAKFRTKKDGRYAITGRCVYHRVDSKNDAQEIIPCNPYVDEGSNDLQGKGDAFCQVGLGGISSYKSGFISGNPGANYGQGEIRRFVHGDTDNQFTNSNVEILHRNFFEDLKEYIKIKQQVYRNSSIPNMAAKNRTISERYKQYIEEFFDAQHFGSAIALFEKGLIAVGANHRLRYKLAGEVLFYDLGNQTHKMRFSLNSENFSAGAQMGEQFGAALVVGDFNGDGKEDLAVGAPTWSKNLKNDKALEVDCGRVYVFDRMSFAINNNWMKEGQSFEGASANAHFGAVLISQDLNRDGFDDLIVSAPHERAEESFLAGSIYIFSGSPTGLHPHFSQKLSPATGRQRFGSSFAFGSRLDAAPRSTGLLAIGDAAASSVFVFETLPTVNLSFFYSRMSRAVVDERSFDCQEGNNCWEVCMFWNSNFTELDDLTLDFEIEAVLDKRLSCTENWLCRVEENLIVDHLKKVPQNVLMCSERVQLNYTIIYSEILKSVELTTKISLSSMGDKFIIDPFSQYLNTTIPVKRACGADNLCNSILTVSDSPTRLEPSMFEYRSRSFEKEVHLEINFRVENDPSYNTVLTIFYPKGFRVRHGKRRLKDGRKRLNNDNDSQKRIARFSLGPKLEQGWIFTEISFFVEPSGETNEETIFWNITNVNDGEPSFISGEESVGFEIKPDIRVEEGQSNILCSQRQFLDTCSEDLQISHIYTIVNEGRIDVNYGSFLIYWPMYSSSEHFILSYESLNVVPEENVKCVRWDQRQFKARNSSVFNEHLDKSGAIDYSCEPQGAATCITIKCEIKHLPHRDSIEIAVNGNFSSTWFAAHKNDTKITSKLVLQIPTDGYVGNILAPQEINIQKSYTTKVNVHQTVRIPLWIVIAASALGVTLMALIFTYCYKVGFFDRVDMYSADTDFVPVHTAVIHKPTPREAQHIQFNLIVQ